MKKLLYTLLAVSIILSACEKEEEETNNTGNNNGSNNTTGLIIGSWDLTEAHLITEEGYYLGGYPNGSKIITDSQDELVLPGDPSWFGAEYGVQSLIWTFLSDGSATESAIYNDGESEVFNFIYEKNGDTLIFQNIIFSIETLSSAKLTVFTGNETQNTVDDGQTITVYFSESIVVMKFDRLSFTPDNSTSKMIHSDDDSFIKDFLTEKDIIKF
jgi:hypothetical protein